jgi:SAM-dependent methyltransferase
VVRSRRPLIRRLLRRALPDRLRRRAARRYRSLTARPPVGWVRYGSLRRVTPVSRNFGFDRGHPVDRHYIEAFLTAHASSDGNGLVRGRVLEIGEDRYASRFADRGRIEQVDVLDPSPENPDANLIADLTDAPQIPSDAYDWIICTQTLLLIWDVHAAVRTLHRILMPGGTLLLTVPGISKICRPEMQTWGDYWRFTSLSARLLVEEAFDPGKITVETYGNVLTAASFLYGLSAEDLRPEELDARDPDYQVLIGVKAVKDAQ